ncbi:hypothetical protein GCM10009087_40580 [Sphingomonas oligophenolica]|uniref:M15 family metallopeptidase n=1 Tax=Sphingomonas oligophenolica TaxID=301154 RepID=A0ABU9Y214_9SPHN
MPKLSDLVPLNSILPFNIGLSSASEETMISCLGRPEPPLTIEDQPDHASAAVKALLVDEHIAQVHAHGIRPAVNSLRTALTNAFKDFPELATALRADGMLVVRLRRPTSGIPSHKISNHSWGTAIDFMLAGQNAPGATGDRLPYFVALLIPYFNHEGWYSGVGFHDDMHFEVADTTIQKWAADGLLKP